MLLLSRIIPVVMVGFEMEVAVSSVHSSHTLLLDVYINIVGMHFATANSILLECCSSRNHGDLPSAAYRLDISGITNVTLFPSSSKLQPHFLPPFNFISAPLSLSFKNTQLTALRCRDS